ncbi:MAG: LVIVD repeat-containing protein [Salinigranum sp.]
MHRREVLRSGVGLGVGLLGGSGVAGARSPSTDAYEPYGKLEVEGARETVVGADGRTAFVAANTGYVTVDVSNPDRPRVLAERRDLLADRDGGPLREVWDAKVDGDSLLVAGPANPRGGVHGVLLVDVSDPADPETRAFFETDYPVHNCFLAGDRAYLTGDDGVRNPLVVVDVSDDDPVEVGRWALADVDAAWESVPPGLRTTHDVWVRGETAFVSSWDAGTWILEVSDPARPRAIGSVGGRPPGKLADLADSDRRPALTPPGNHHSAATDESGALLGIGKESWAVETDGTLRGGPSGIELWDVSDPGAPEHRATIDPPPTPNPTYGGRWTTAHNFEIRGGVLYSSWYQGGVKRHDVSDPGRPREVTWWRAPERANFWTARLAAPGARDGFFVASSVGDAHGDLENAPARLYTFPDRPGGPRR